MDWFKYLPNISWKNLLPNSSWKELVPFDPILLTFWIPNWESGKSMTDWSPSLEKSSFSQLLQQLEQSKESEINWMIIFKDNNFDPADFDQFTVIQTGPRYQHFRSSPETVLNWLSNSPNNPSIESVVIIGSK